MGKRFKQSRGRHNVKLGRLSADELLVHRELETLRVARHGSAAKVSKQFDKLTEARRVATKYGTR